MQTHVWIRATSQCDVKITPILAKYLVALLHRRRKNPHAASCIHLTALFLYALMSAHAAFAQAPAQCAATNSPASQTSIAAFVSEAAHRFGLPVPLIDAVIHVESFGQMRAVSPKGAMGLMQIMPATWEILRVQYGLGDDACDAHDNITAGAAYLRQMYDRFGPVGFLAAFNAGPGRYENFLTTGHSLPNETRLYLAKVGPLLADKAIDGSILATRNPSPWTQSPVFVGSAARNSEQQADNNSADNDVPIDQRSGRSIAQTFALAPQSSGLFVRDAELGRLP